jgi:hypothetical protein
MAEQLSTTFTRANEVDNIQSNDFNVNLNPQLHNRFSDAIANRKILHHSQHIEHQPSTTTQPIITTQSSTNSFGNSHISSTIDPELKEGKETSNVENSAVGNNNGSSGEYGLELWNKRREMWIRGNSENPESSNRNNPALANITPNNYHSIYDSLIYEKKKLAKPVPLPYVVCILDFCRK